MHSFRCSPRSGTAALCWLLLGVASVLSGGKAPRVKSGSRSKDPSGARMEVRANLRVSPTGSIAAFGPSAWQVCVAGRAVRTLPAGAFSSGFAAQSVLIDVQPRPPFRARSPDARRRDGERGRGGNHAAGRSGTLEPEIPAPVQTATAPTSKQRRRWTSPIS